MMSLLGRSCVTIMFPRIQMAVTLPILIPVTRLMEPPQRQYLSRDINALATRNVFHRVTAQKSRTSKYMIVAHIGSYCFQCLRDPPDVGLRK